VRGRMGVCKEGLSDGTCKIGELYKFEEVAQCANSYDEVAWKFGLSKRTSRRVSDVRFHQLPVRK
jgi:hypothetical protein